MIAEKSLPNRIGVLKIDTEGYDLEVIRGLGETQPDIIMTEFWGKDFLFVRESTDKKDLALADQIISEAASRGYAWNVVVYRIEGEPAIRFTFNVPDVPAKAWGNLLFCRSPDLLQKTLSWCYLMLPRFQD
jgi:hypothetical protein